MKSDFDKEEAKYLHKLELRKIVIDKLLFGVLIALIGLVANIVLENYRSDLAKQKFILEKQFEAIREISDAYDDLYRLWDDFTLNLNSNDLPGDYWAKSLEKENIFYEKYNKWTMALPVEFDRHMEQFLWLHSGIRFLWNDRFRAMDDQEIFEHKKFLGACRHRFLRICRGIIGIQDKKLANEFILEEWSYSKAEPLGAEVYYFANFNKWQKNKPE